MREPDQLDQLLGDLRSGTAADAKIGYYVEAAITRWRTPPRIQVTGRGGVGRTTVLHALALLSAEETEPVDQPGQPDPVLAGDIIIYVLAGAPTAADRRMLGTLRPDRVIVVLNKADAMGSRWADAVGAATQASQNVRLPVLPIVASLAARTRAGTLTETDMATLHRHTDVAAAFTLSPDLFVDAAVGADIAERTELLNRWDLYGVNCALAAIGQDPELPAAAVLQVMHAASAIDPLHRMVHHHYELVAAQRGGDLLNELTRLAARALPEEGSRGRDLLMAYLSSDEALWTGLCAGLATPEVAHLAAGYPSPAPMDADDALARANRWRAVIASDMPAPARRAAVWVHNGYVRQWERMSNAGF